MFGIGEMAVEGRVVGEWERCDHGGQEFQALRGLNAFHTPHAAAWLPCCQGPVEFIEGAPQPQLGSAQLPAHKATAKRCCGLRFRKVAECRRGDEWQLQISHGGHKGARALHLLCCRVEGGGGRRVEGKMRSVGIQVHLLRGGAKWGMVSVRPIYESEYDDSWS